MLIFSLSGRADRMQDIGFNLNFIELYLDMPSGFKATLMYGDLCLLSRKLIWISCKFKKKTDFW